MSVVPSEVNKYRRIQIKNVHGVVSYQYANPNHELD